MSVNLEELGKPFPQTAHKQRSVQGKSLTYVEGHTVIHRLNAATNNTWSMEIKAIDTITIDQNWKQVTAHVALTIPGLGTREHIGIQDVHVKGPDLVKGAITDALKKAATLFGVGLELYGPDYEAGETGPPPNGSYQQQRPAPNGNPPQQGLGFQQQRPQASPDRPASQKQVGFISKLAEERGIARPDLHAQAGVASLNELSSAAASDLIEWLQARPAGIPAGPRQEPQRGWEQGQRGFEDMPPEPPDDYDHYTN